MRNTLFVAASAIALFTATQASAVITTSSQMAVSPPATGLKTTFGGMTTIDFESTAAGAQPTGFTPATGSAPGGGVVAAGSTTLYSAPAGDTSKFYAVAYNPSTGPVVPATDTFTPGGSYTYFGLYWGSIDAYNTITFLNGATQVGQVYTGTQFLPASGNQSSPATNMFVDFVFTGGDRYTSVVFGTRNLNFELDNVAYGDVPEPATWGLMVLGFGAVGGALRTSRRKVVFA